MKTMLILLTVLLLGPLAALHAAGLGVVNGDFGDLSRLKPLGGHEWYQGATMGVRCKRDLRWTLVAGVTVEE